jgi:transglutaminase-like putative cysteine protease
MWVVAAALALLPQGVRAQPFYRDFWYSVHEVRAGGNYTQDVFARFEMKQEAALASFRRYLIPFSLKNESAQVLQAYVLKKDGRVLEVQGRSVRHAPFGGTASEVVFSDREGLVVEMPALEVNDSLYLHFRILSRKPAMPGSFTLEHRLPPLSLGEDVRVIVRAPVEMRLHTEAQGMSLRERVAGRTRVLEWTQSSPRKEPALVRVSSFRSYDEMVLAYLADVSAKAAPTREIRALAAQIIADETRPREKARLLYEWVSTYLDGVGDCTRAGETVPNPTSWALTKFFAGCRDHATVLQALLAAASIESEQVLLAAEGEGQLPAIAVAAALGQAINYLPGWDMYLDASERGVVFGELPLRRYSRPAIHVRARPFSTFTPAAPAR